MLILKSLSSLRRFFLESDWYLNFSHASAEFEINSRKNISLSLYKEFATRSKSLLTSA